MLAAFNGEELGIGCLIRHALGVSEGHDAISRSVNDQDRRVYAIAMVGATWR